MKKILISIFLLILVFCLTACANKGIDFNVAFDNECAFGYKKESGYKCFSDAYITSKDQLISLCTEWNNNSFNENYGDENSSLSKALTSYDDEFFKTNNLIIIEFETGRSIDTKVKKINVEENSLIVTIKQKEKYGIFTSEAFRWVIMIEVPKESTQGVTELVVNFKK